MAQLLFDFTKHEVSHFAPFCTLSVGISHSEFQDKNLCAFCGLCFDRNMLGYDLVTALISRVINILMKSLGSGCDQLFVIPSCTVTEKYVI